MKNVFNSGFVLLCPKTFLHFSVQTGISSPKTIRFVKFVRTEPGQWLGVPVGAVRSGTSCVQGAAGASAFCSISCCRPYLPVLSGGSRIPRNRPPPPPNRFHPFARRPVGRRPRSRASGTHDLLHTTETCSVPL